jgi:hypothetical protein
MLARPRSGADVGQQADPSAFEEVEKGIDLPSAVADRVDPRHVSILAPSRELKTAPPRLR